MPLPTYPLTVFYDGACGLCAAEMARYRARDAHGRLTMVNITAPGFDAHAQGLDPALVREYLHARDATGTTVRGVDAFAWVWEACGMRVLPRLIRLPGIRALARAAYRFVALHRYTLSGNRTPQSCEHCRVPMP